MSLNRQKRQIMLSDRRTVSKQTLRKVWSQNQIDPSMQIIFQQYLAFLEQQEEEVQIQKQIQLVQNKQSMVLKVQQLASKRSLVLQKIKLLIEINEGSKLKGQKNIFKICKNIQELRSINVSLGEKMLSIHYYFSQKIIGTFICINMTPLFQQLHTGHEFISKSFLRKFIVFSRSYDPFFLRHYKLLKQTQNPKLRQFPAIQELFTLTSSEANRYQHVQLQIQQYLDSRNSDYPKPLKKVKHRNFKTSRTTVRQDDDIRESQAKKNNFLSNKLYQSNTNYHQNRVSPQPDPNYYTISSYQQNRNFPFNEKLPSEISQSTYQPQNLKPVNLRVRSMSNSPDLYKKKAVEIKPKQTLINTQGRYVGFIRRYTPLRQNGSISSGDKYKKSQYDQPNKIYTQRDPKLQLTQMKSQHQQNKDDKQPNKQLNVREKKQNERFRPVFRRSIEKKAVLENQNEQAVNQPTLVNEYKKKLQNNQQNENKEQKNNDPPVFHQTKEQNEKSPKTTKRHKKRSEFQRQQNKQTFDEKSYEQPEPSKTPNRAEFQNKLQPEPQYFPQKKKETSKSIKKKKKKEEPQKEGVQKQTHKEQVMQKKSNQRQSVQQKPKQNNQQKSITGLSSKRQQNKSEIKPENNEGKKIVIKINQKLINTDQLIKLIGQWKIQKDYRSKCEIGNWQNCFLHNQYYLHKFFINNQLQAISLCCSLPQGDINIKYWGPFQTCTPKDSEIFFAKYIQFLQKVTPLRTIYYNANPIKQLALNAFIKKKQRIYERQRVILQSVQPTQYTYFLSIQFTNIAINKSTQKQEEFIIQEGIEPFGLHKFLIFNYLLIINKLMHPGTFSSVATYNPQLPHMQATKQQILSQYLSDAPYNPQFKGNYFNLLTLKLNTPLLSAFFVMDKGFLKLFGDLCYEDSDSLIVSTQMLRNNTKLYFGKGMKDVTMMFQKVRKSSKRQNATVQFAIRMFKKTLRGKINCINLKEQNCYGDLTISFQWKDYLPGKISHNLQQCEQVFDNNFYCLVEMEKQMLFAFEVVPANFVK